MNISAPKQITLLISVLIAVLAALVHWNVLPIAQLHSGFTVLGLGYLLLLAGNLLRGL